MGAAPSHEAEEGYLQELKGRRHRAWRAERRRKEIAMLPLTKRFMHSIQPSVSSRPNTSHSPKTDEGQVPRDGFSDSTSTTSCKDFIPAQRVDDAPPATLPFIQQLYSVYREPSTQFYCRKETWGTVNTLPPELFYPTIESFYAATVGCYEEELYESNNVMQQVLEEHLMKERLHSLGIEPVQKGAEPARRPPKASKALKIRPTPCAICFEYPTCTVAPPPTPPLLQDGTAVGPSAASLKRSGAPHGSVVFAPYCSFMVIGFVGLVPVRHTKKASSAAFLRPPANSVGDEGEGSVEAGDEDAAYELVAFIAKAAGEQHLGRALFHAAFLYTEQCRRAGLCVTPVPSIRFSCLHTDVPSLCFLREVRLRCAEAGWTTRLAHALRRFRLAGRHLALQVDGRVAGDLCAFMAECYEKLDFHPPPTSASCLFYGFVGDADSQVLPSSDASPSISPSPLPLSGSAEVKAALKDKAERDAWLRHSGLGGISGGGGSGRDEEGNNIHQGNHESNKIHLNHSVGTTVQLYCIVGTKRLTVDGRVVYPHGTVLEQTVDVTTGNFTTTDWTVAEDQTGQERPPIDFCDAALEEANDDCVTTGVTTAKAEKAPRQAMVASNVLLSWSKDLYLHARAAEAKDTHWVSAYPPDYYTSGRGGYTTKPTTAQMESLKPPKLKAEAHEARSSPLTAVNIQAATTHQPTSTVAHFEMNASRPAVATDTSNRGDAAGNSFYVWEFEHQKHRYTVGLVPNFVRAQQRKLANTAGAVQSRKKNQGKKSSNSTNPPAAPESVDPMSEAGVSSAASHRNGSLGSNSGHSSDRSGRSADTYHTAASSHSTMSNFAMTQGRRSSRQRRYFLSLGTGSVYENGVEVSTQIPPIAKDHSLRAVSDDGLECTRRSLHGGAGSFAEDGVSADLIHGRTNSCEESGKGSSNNNNSQLQRDLRNSLVHEVPRQQQQQQVALYSPHAHVHHLYSTQPLQRRLSGGVSQGVRSRHNSEGTGDLLPPVIESGGEAKESGGAEVNVSARHHLEATQKAVFPMLKVQHDPRARPQPGPRRGIYGPAQALSKCVVGGTPPAMTTSATAKSEPPVMNAPGSVQTSHRSAEGAIEYRWDWRGVALPKKEGSGK